MLSPDLLLGFIESLGSMEMFLIFVIVLVLFGGEKLPEFARGLGKTVREFKKAASGVEEEFKRALDEDERKKTVVPAIMPPDAAHSAAGPDAETQVTDEYHHDDYHVNDPYHSHDSHDTPVDETTPTENPVGDLSASGSNETSPTPLVPPVASEAITGGPTLESAGPSTPTGLSPEERPPADQQALSPTEPPPVALHESPPQKAPPSSPANSTPPPTQT